MDHGPEPRELGLGDCAFAPCEIDEQDRKGALVHLDATPIRSAIEPTILRPMAVRFLNGLQVANDIARRVLGTDRKKPTRNLHEIARPD